MLSAAWCLKIGRHASLVRALQFHTQVSSCCCLVTTTRVHICTLCRCLTVEADSAPILSKCVLTIILGGEPFCRCFVWGCGAHQDMQQLGTQLGSAQVLAMRWALMMADYFMAVLVSGSPVFARKTGGRGGGKVKIPQKSELRGF